MPGIGIRTQHVISDAWATWARENPNEYVDNFEPTEMKIGSVAFEAKVDGDLEFTEGEIVGLATPKVALAERRPIIPALTRIHSFLADFVFPGLVD